MPLLVVIGIVLWVAATLIILVATGPDQYLFDQHDNTEWFLEWEEEVDSNDRPR